MVKCAVLSCKHDSRRQSKRDNNISFHRFPKNRETIDAWVNAIKRPNWVPNIRSAICSIHFDSSFVSETRKGLRRLVQEAVPELYLEDISIKQELDEDMTSCSGSANIKSENATTNIASVWVVGDDTGTPNVTPQELRLTRRLIQVQEIAKRRRLRCNALYVQRNRLKKQNQFLRTMVTELRKKLLTYKLAKFSIK